MEIDELNNSIEATKCQITALQETLEKYKDQMTDIQQEVADAKVGFYSLGVLINLIGN